MRPPGSLFLFERDDWIHAARTQSRDDAAGGTNRDERHRRGEERGPAFNEASPQTAE
jgi:hypothetical protein